MFLELIHVDRFSSGVTKSGLFKFQRLDDKSASAGLVKRFISTGLNLQVQIVHFGATGCGFFFGLQTFFFYFCC